MIDLNPRHLATVERILAEHAPGLEVRAFGSRATWTAKEYSDLDLALVGESRLDTATIWRLKEAFSESDLPIRVDVLDWHAISDKFREAIGPDCVVVQNQTTGEDWPEVTIGEIADIVGGSTPSTKDPDNFGGDIPWLTPKDLSGSHDRYIARGERNLTQQGLDSCSAKLLPAGAVLLSTRAPVGYVAIAKNPIATNQGFRSLIPRDGVCGEYLYYWLSVNTEELERHSSGSTFRELSGKALKSIKLRLPPMGEQRRIAGVLGCLDDKIELNRRMAETLEEMARALFRSWFVDFEPVRAKQEGRWRSGESLPGLPAQLYESFPDRLEPSPLGPIPAGWQVAALDEIATFLNGLALQKFPAQGAESIPAIKIAQLRAGHTDRADPVSPDIPPQFHVNDGDVLFSWSGSLELVVWASGQGALNQHLFKVDPIGLPKWFVYHWVEQHLPEFRQIAADKATTMGHIKRHHLSDAQVVVPPSDALALLGATSAALFDNALRARVEARQLVAIRDAVLPWLLSNTAGSSQSM